MQKYPLSSFVINVQKVFINHARWGKLLSFDGWISLMKEKQAKEELLKILTKHLEFKSDSFERAVNLATDFSKENYISSDSLLKLAHYC